MDGALQGVPQGPAREVYEFKIPESYDCEACHESISLCKLRSAEEVEATRACQGESMRLAWELSKMSLCEVDGRRLARGDGEVDAAWDKFDPKLRALVVAAYAKLHTPEDDETENFLATMTTKVG